MSWRLDAVPILEEWLLEIFSFDSGSGSNIQTKTKRKHNIMFYLAHIWIYFVRKFIIICIYLKISNSGYADSRRK